MYTKIQKHMGLKYLHYNKITSHYLEIDLICRAQVAH